MTTALIFGLVVSVQKKAQGRKGIIKAAWFTFSSSPAAAVNFATTKEQNLTNVAQPFKNKWSNAGSGPNLGLVQFTFGLFPLDFFPCKNYWSGGLSK